MDFKSNQNKGSKTNYPEHKTLYLTTLFSMQKKPTMQRCGSYCKFKLLLNYFMRCAKKPFKF